MVGEVGEERVTISSRVTLEKGVETRRHVITAPAGIEFVEGSRAFATVPGKQAAIAVRGYESTSVEKETGANIVHPQTWIVALRGKTAGETTTLESRFK